MPFPKLLSKAPQFLDHPERCLTRQGLVELVCPDCPFYKEDEKDYQCGALELMGMLLKKGELTVEGIVRAAQG